MRFKILIPILALIGLCFVTYEIIKGPAPERAEDTLSAIPAGGTRAHGLAGLGIVEANTGNIVIAPTVEGVVTDVYGEVGSPVQKGDPLFKIDDRLIRAELPIREAQIQVQSRILEQAQYELQLAVDLHQQAVISDEAYQKLVFSVRKSEAELALAQAAKQKAETELELAVVRAPVDGQILQVNIHPGELASLSNHTPQDAPMIVGGICPLYVRVNIDEYDAWRIRHGVSAVGYLRGNDTFKVDLDYVRTEPYIVPKASLTGYGAERVDTRIAQVLFSFQRGSLPIYVGQEMDVYLEETESSK